MPEITPADVAVITEAQAAMYDNINRLLQADVNRLAAENKRLRAELAHARSEIRHLVTGEEDDCAG